MLRSTVRSALVSISSLAAASPIEAITVTFILITLTYFQLLHAIKGSDFFQVPQTAPPARPVHLVRLANPWPVDDSPYILPSTPSSAYGGLNASPNSPWAPLPASDFRRILEANALEGGYHFSSGPEGEGNGDRAEVVLIKQLTVVKEDVDASTEEWVHWLLHDVAIDINGQRYTYQDLCYECDTALVPHPIHSSQSTLTMYLRPPTPDTPTLTYLNHIARLPAFTPTGTNSTLRLLPQSSGSWGFLPSFDGAGLFTLGDANAQSDREEADDPNGLRNVRWFGYAVRALVMRFYGLAKVSI